MATTTIASAAQMKDGDLFILVEAGEAASLHGFLKSKNVVCSNPSPAIWRPRRVTRDSMGRLNIEEDVLECEIIAQGNFDDFGKWMDEWIKSKIGQI